MKLLVLGGTRFVGRHIVAAALAAGHDVTLFNRGTSKGLFAGVEEVHGDREHDLGRLGAGSWDAVIDTSAYVPRVLRESASHLAHRVNRYLFISSISVYPDEVAAGVNEEGALQELGDPASENVREDYGALKAACEGVLREVLGDRALVIRPGIVVGPFDPTFRFTYWVRRIAAGGRVLAPGDPGAPVQFIDGRDLGRWAVLALERGLKGAFNATGPAQPLTMAGMLAAIAAGTGAEPTLEWVPANQLTAAGLRPGALPWWLPPAMRGLDGGRHRQGAWRQPWPQPTGAERGRHAGLVGRGRPAGAGRRRHQSGRRSGDPGTGIAPAWS